MNHHKNLSLKNIVAKVDGVWYEEQWVEVNGFEKLYLISSFGRVKSLRTGLVMKQHIVSGKGYLSISLHSGGQKLKCKVHRLVAMNFHPNHEGKPQVNHDDFDKTNNFYKNLLWATGKENTNHAQRGGRMPTAKPKIKIEERPIRMKMVRNIETGIVYDSALSVAVLLGFPEKEVRRRLSGERKNDIPFQYVKNKYSLFYPKQHERNMVRYRELREKIFGLV